MNILGTNLDEALFGTSLADLMDALLGNDTVDANKESDRIILTSIKNYGNHRRILLNVIF